ncbi:MAG: hypothetical protein AB1331_07165, partial [Bacillota bacterium]
LRGSSTGKIRLIYSTIPATDRGTFSQSHFGTKGVTFSQSVDIYLIGLVSVKQSWVIYRIPEVSVLEKLFLRLANLAF